MIIQIVNAKSDMSAIKRGVYVGRGQWMVKPSPLANPFKIPRDGGRAQVIAKYQDWLRCRIQSGDRDVLDELARLASIVVHTGKLELVCWCSPLSCHGDVIRATIEEVLRKEDCAC